MPTLVLASQFARFTPKLHVICFTNMASMLDTEKDIDRRTITAVDAFKTQNTFFDSRHDQR